MTIGIGAVTVAPVVNAHIDIRQGGDAIVGIDGAGDLGRLIQGKVDVAIREQSATDLKDRGQVRARGFLVVLGDIVRLAAEAPVPATAGIDLVLAVGQAGKRKAATGVGAGTVATLLDVHVDVGQGLGAIAVVHRTGDHATLVQGKIDVGGGVRRAAELDDRSLVGIDGFLPVFADVGRFCPQAPIPATTGDCLIVAVGQPLYRIVAIGVGAGAKVALLNVHVDVLQRQAVAIIDRARDLAAGLHGEGDGHLASAGDVDRVGLVLAGLTIVPLAAPGIVPPGKNHVIAIGQATHVKAAVAHVIDAAEKGAVRLAIHRDVADHQWGRAIRLVDDA